MNPSEVAAEWATAEAAADCKVEVAEWATAEATTDCRVEAAGVFLSLSLEDFLLASMKANSTSIDDCYSASVEANSAEV